MTLWQQQITGLQQSIMRPCVDAHVPAKSNTPARPSAAEREKSILALLTEHGPHDVVWITNQMDWTESSVNRRLARMLNKGTVSPLPTWPRTWKAV